MPTTVKGLKERLAALAQDQVDLVNDGERTWAEKRDEYDRREEDIKAIGEQVKTFTDAENFAALVDAQAGGNDAGRNDEPVKSYGEQFTDEIAEKGYTGAARFSSGPVALKATSPNLAEVGYPQQLPGIVPQPMQRPMVAQLFGQGTTTQGSLTYTRETAFTNSAAAVAEGGAKPQSQLELETVTEALKKVAHWIRVSDESLSDLPQLMSHINGRLLLGVQLAEENQVLNGSGTGSEMTGLLNTAGIGNVTEGDDEFAAIYGAITEIRTNAFLEPDAMVVHPTDWRDLRLAKDSNGQYFAGGPFMGPYGAGGIAGESVFGVRAVVTPAVAEGTFVLGAFAQGAMFWRRGGVSIEATNSHEDDFTNDLVTIRGEERGLLTVWQPTAFATVNYTAPAG